MLMIQDVCCRVQVAENKGWLANEVTWQENRNHQSSRHQMRYQQGRMMVNDPITRNDTNHHVCPPDETALGHKQHTPQCCKDNSNTTGNLANAPSQTLPTVPVIQYHHCTRFVSVSPTQKNAVKQTAEWPQQQTHHTHQMIHQSAKLCRRTKAGQTLQ